MLSIGGKGSELSTYGAGRSSEDMFGGLYLCFKEVRIHVGWFGDGRSEAIRDC